MSKLNIIQTLDFSSYSIAFSDEQIAIIIFKRFTDVIPNHVFEIQEKTSQFFTAPYAVIISAEDNVTFGRKTRESFGARKTRCIADAFIVKNLAERLILNFYIKVHTKSTPVKSFTTTDSALEWLRDKIKLAV